MKKTLKNIKNTTTKEELSQIFSEVTELLKKEKPNAKKSQRLSKFCMICDEIFEKNISEAIKSAYEVWQLQFDAKHPSEAWDMFEFELEFPMEEKEEETEQKNSDENNTTPTPIVIAEPDTSSKPAPSTMVVPVQPQTPVCQVPPAEPEPFYVYEQNHPQDNRVRIRKPRSFSSAMVAILLIAVVAVALFKLPSNFGGTRNEATAQQSAIFEENGYIAYYASIPAKNECTVEVIATADETVQIDLDNVFWCIPIANGSDFYSYEYETDVVKYRVSYHKELPRSEVIKVLNGAIIEIANDQAVLRTPDGKTIYFTIAYTGKVK